MAATIITGGGRGIGRAIALRMAHETAVIVVGRTEADLQSLCQEIKNRGGFADYLVGDVARPATAKRAVARVKKNGWTLRNLVINAGIAKGGPAHTFDRKLWKEIFAVNVDGALYFSQECLPTMMEQKGGTITFINSISGVQGFKYDCAYTASKHAQLGLARSLALEYAKHGIVVVPICPHFVESEMTRRTVAGLVRHRGMTEAEAENTIKKTNPQRRIIPAEEVAEAVALVASGKLPSLNGHPMMLTGGA
jgi:3-hydroxybutyrate dehydrogenase